MNRRSPGIIAASTLLAAVAAGAQEMIIEPDDYSSGAILDTVSGAVTLSIADTDNEVISLFRVTASNDGMGFAPTGTRVFGHANVPFINDIRRLRLDFTDPASRIELQFSGGDSFEPEIGRLRAYSASGALLAEYATQPRCCGDVEIMVIERNAPEIAWAVALVADGEGNFGRMDALRARIGGGLPCAEDLNADGRVDLTDLATLLTNFGMPGGATQPQGDVDGDGDVDLGDLARLLIRFGGNC